MNPISTLLKERDIELAKKFDAFPAGSTVWLTHPDGELAEAYVRNPDGFWHPTLNTLVISALYPREVGDVEEAGPLASWELASVIENHPGLVVEQIR